jgi:hypothetical protein
MKPGRALNQVKPDFHLVRARWIPGFTWFGPTRSMRTAVLAVPA